MLFSCAAVALQTCRHVPYIMLWDIKGFQSPGYKPEGLVRTCLFAAEMPSMVKARPGRFYVFVRTSQGVSERVHSCPCDRY
jgi:hypothetical protein